MNPLPQEKSVSPKSRLISMILAITELGFIIDLLIIK